MIIGVPREIKTHEYRVSVTPAGVLELTRRGHEVLVEKEAGAGSGLSDEEYVSAGAKIVDGPQAVFDQAELVVKVKEPLAEERRMLRADQVMFTYFHFAADRTLTEETAATAEDTLKSRDVRLIENIEKRSSDLHAAEVKHGQFELPDEGLADGVSAGGTVA